jgi:hypothetical protein
MGFIKYCAFPVHGRKILSESLQSVTLSSLLIYLVDSTAFAQPPRRGPRPPSQFRQQRQAEQLKKGDVAPDFTLKSPDGKKTITLSDFQGKKPVALVFGSYT